MNNKKDEIGELKSLINSVVGQNEKLQSQLSVTSRASDELHDMCDINGNGIQAGHWCWLTLIWLGYFGGFCGWGGGGRIPPPFITSELLMMTS